jgi:WhiB family transcriptional regulator, redox-sensing transcriptional regulator
MNEASNQPRQAPLAGRRLAPADRPTSCGRCGADARPCRAEFGNPTGLDVPVDLPCQVHDPDLWFADAPADLEFAKALCAGCPARLACLTGALERREATGVWGGEIFDHGQLVTYKRSRGRPRKNSTPPRRYPAPPAQRSPEHPTQHRVDEHIAEIAIEPAVSGRHRIRLHDLTPPNRTTRSNRHTGPT